MANISHIHTNSKYQPYSYKWLMSALFIGMANVSPIREIMSVPIHTNG